MEQSLKGTDPKSAAEQDTNDPHPPARDEDISPAKKLLASLKQGKDPNVH